jgi:hypothetical protein
MKRGREPAGRLGNNPETGCWRVAHYDSLIGNGSHVIMISQPDAVTEVILTTLKSVS